MLPPLLALLSFPIVVAILFARLQPALAMIVSILVGYLVLPRGTALDLPMLPALDKDFIPAFSAMIAMLIVLAQKKTTDPHVLPGWLPKSNLARLFLLAALAAAVGMVLTNGDRLVFLVRELPALRPYDTASLILNTAVVLLPFLLARRFAGHPDMNVLLLKCLVVAGLIYSLLAMWEARMSPQLHIQLYGYFQHMWNQHVRGGGFRPIVFLQHGLWVSIFFSTATLSALALVRQSTGPDRMRYLCAAGWLLLTLVITKSLGALLITLVLAPVILFLTVRMQLLVAAALAAMVVTYPMLRGAGVIPIDRVTSLAESIDPNRALSFNARLHNEELLLAKAQERPLFGWGTWGRNRVYNEDGFGVTVPDGYWIILIGSRGWVGYVGFLGLVSVGIFGLAWQSRRLDVTPATAGLAVVLAGNMVDLIPNATLTPLTWMMAGALLGRLEHGVLAAPDAEASQAQPDPPPSRYSRFGPGNRPGTQVPSRVRPSYSSSRVRHAER